MRRARSRAERRAGLAGTLPLFCTQRWASAKMQDAACRHGPAGSRELESFGKATLHGQGRALGYTSRSLGHCHFVAFCFPTDHKPRGDRARKDYGTV